MKNRAKAGVQFFDGPRRRESGVRMYGFQRREKHHFVMGITECMTELPDYASEGNMGRPPMKTLLVGIAFAIGVVFASQAFALPYCPNSTWQHGHYVCASYDE